MEKSTFGQFLRGALRRRVPPVVRFVVRMRSRNNSQIPKPLNSPHMYKYNVYICIYIYIYTNIQYIYIYIYIGPRISKACAEAPARGLTLEQ